MASLEEIPVFAKNFDGFLHYLRDATVPSTSISPKRFGRVLHVDMQTLANMAHVHRNTLSRAPEAESVQQYLRQTVQVVRAAVDVVGSVEEAIFWFRNHPLPTFDYKTAQQLVSEGRTEILIRYIQSLQAGFAG